MGCSCFVVTSRGGAGRWILTKSKLENRVHSSIRTLRSSDGRAVKGRNSMGVTRGRTSLLTGLTLAGFRTRQIQ